MVKGQRASCLVTLLLAFSFWFGEICSFSTSSSWQRTDQLRCPSWTSSALRYVPLCRNTLPACSRPQRATCSSLTGSRGCGAQMSTSPRRLRTCGSSFSLWASSRRLAICSTPSWAYWQNKYWAHSGLMFWSVCSLRLFFLRSELLPPTCIWRDVSECWGFLSRPSLIPSSRSELTLLRFCSSHARSWAGAPRSMETYYPRQSSLVWAPTSYSCLEKPGNRCYSEHSSVSLSATIGPFCSI